ncbi:alpha/beta hydrolase [Oceanirhabdus sp. W0125-5]|uniref:alpha/beta hydrolase n=1 Tax=Oceanirhabdus sp. W0125-5 TaxID=2999116 RepID=UPI0022F3163B|nr:alpha/beta hydrolase-fold protein [Oceanirhabdus sp. W0125-5]WBW97788.1 alpha/beta hydrolase-fold protein [Oceanirhabdus sp. W0125-5]
MSKNKQKSNVINELYQEIESGNIKFLDSFWSTIEEIGTPIIESIDGDNNYSLVTFIYKGDENTDTLQLYIPTNVHPDNIDNTSYGLSEFKFECIPNTNVWYTSCIALNDVRFSYKLLLNCPFEKIAECPEKMIKDEFGRDKLVFPDDEDHKNDYVINYVLMPAATEHIWVKERGDSLKGEIKTHSSHSNILKNERNIAIYTPSNYSNENEPYNLLIITDGSVYLDISGKEILDNLINDNKIPPTVAVFIDSNDHRMSELMCNDHFSAYIVEEVIPWVREHYNVTEDASKTIIAGSSLGGLTASFMGLRYPNIFGNILSQSGSYWYKGEDMEDPEKRNWIARQFKKIDKLPLKFYLNVGVLESSRMYSTNQEFKEVLESKGYPVSYEEFKSGHDYLSWGETLGTGLIALIGNE